MDERGHITFRAALPDGPPGPRLARGRRWAAGRHPEGLSRLADQRRYAAGCEDVSAGEAQPRFLHRHLGSRAQGALLEPHHNTYDIEFWGPDGMCTSIYLRGAGGHGQMAEAMREKADAARYRQLRRGQAKYLEKKLFNGEFFDQKVQWKGLQADAAVRQDALGPEDVRHMRLAQILEAEGPRVPVRPGLPLGRRHRRLDGAAVRRGDAAGSRSIRKHLESIFTAQLPRGSV